VRNAVVARWEAQVGVSGRRSGAHESAGGGAAPENEVPSEELGTRSLSPMASGPRGGCWHEVESFQLLESPGLWASAAGY
jgi:hypothetical protein